LTTSSRPNDSAAVQNLLAFEQIRQLVARYAIAVDSRDIEALVHLFVEDVQVGARQQGRDALYDYFDRSLREVSVTILNTGTHLIELDDDDHAHGVVYCRAEIQDQQQWIVQAIQYRDAYERRQGRWHFTRRQHLLWYGREIGTSPIGLRPANWPERHVGSGELPQAWPTWAAFWAGDRRSEH